MPAIRAGAGRPATERDARSPFGGRAGTRPTTRYGYCELAQETGGRLGRAASLVP